eukprot:Tbor_TRINITY_DN5457_c1_g3::TRINITY_DN5457_c1_g3_i1::g.24085::m.24085
MVVVKGGGITYEIGSGKKMTWEEVPATFKKELEIQIQLQPEQCKAIRAETQQCIEEKGFWNEKCCELREAFDLCIGNSFRGSLAGTRPDNGSTSSAASSQ